MEDTFEQSTPIMSSPVASAPVTPPVAQSAPLSKNQPIQDPPKNSNIFIILLVVAIVLFGVLLGVLAFKYLTVSGSSLFSSPTNTTIPPSDNSDETSGWRTYSNPELRYSIKYPSNWTLLDISKGKLIEIFNQPDKTKPVGEILIEKVSLRPRNLDDYIDTLSIGNTQTRCYSDKALKTWCYLEDGKSVKISFLITKDQDETYNLILFKILSTFSLTPEITKISAEQLTAGWYWGNKEQKLPGTPPTWIYTDGGKNSCWHEKGVVCQVTPSNTTNYSCPSSGWVDCMPVLDEAKTIACSVEAMNWYKTNCPNFQGAAL